MKCEGFSSTGSCPPRSIHPGSGPEKPSRSKTWPVNITQTWSLPTLEPALCAQGQSSQGGRGGGYLGFNSTDSHLLRELNQGTAVSKCPPWHQQRSMLTCWLVSIPLENLAANCAVHCVRPLPSWRAMDWSWQEYLSLPVVTNCLFCPQSLSQHHYCGLTYEMCEL